MTTFFLVIVLPFLFGLLLYKTDEGLFGGRFITRATTKGRAITALIVFLVLWIILRIVGAVEFASIFLFLIIVPMKVLGFAAAPWVFTRFVPWAELTFGSVKPFEKGPNDPVKGGWEGFIDLFTSAPKPGVIITPPPPQASQEPSPIVTPVAPAPSAEPEVSDRDKLHSFIKK